MNQAVGSSQVSQYQLVFPSCRTFIQEGLFCFAALLHANNQKLCQSLHAHTVLVSHVPARASLSTVFTLAVYTKRAEAFSITVTEGSEHARHQCT